MQLPDIKQLKAIIKLCQQNGIETLEIDGIKLVFAPHAVSSDNRKASKPINDKLLDTLPTMAESAPKQSALIPTNAPYSEDSLTPEELLMWSAGDMPNGDSNQ